VWDDIGTSIFLAGLQSPLNVRETAGSRAPS